LEPELKPELIMKINLN